MQKISITEPCSANWDNMQARADGRWCTECKLTVTDFTKMSNQQIVDYLEAKKGERVCGHCRIDQVQSPKKTWPKWMASFLAFIFGVSLLSSCHRHVQGCMAYFPESTPGKNHKQETKSDSAHSSHFEKIK